MNDSKCYYLSSNSCYFSRLFNAKGWGMKITNETIGRKKDSEAASIMRAIAAVHRKIKRGKK